MLAGKHRCPPVLYVAIVAMVLALAFLGFWARYHTNMLVAPPLHDKK